MGILQGMLAEIKRISPAFQHWLYEKFNKDVPGLDKTARGLGIELALIFILFSSKTFCFLLLIAPEVELSNRGTLTTDVGELSGEEKSFKEKYSGVLKDCRDLVSNSYWSSWSPCSLTFTFGYIVILLADASGLIRRAFSILGHKNSHKILETTKEREQRNCKWRIISFMPFFDCWYKKAYKSAISTGWYPGRLPLVLFRQ